MDLTRYRTLVFDSDGVILDSNAVKTQAFYTAALPYGAANAQALVDYHVRRGGISRYVKFEYFLSDIVRQPVTEQALQTLLQAFADEVQRGLMQSVMAPGLEALRQATPHASWMVVTGGDQAELREVYAQRAIAAWFDAGLYGSPDSKHEILERELRRGNLRTPAIFLGDSRYDHEAATQAGLDFVFVSGWTEFEGWADYCTENRIPTMARVGI